MSVARKLRKLLTFRFISEQLFKGVLQAVGGVTVYILIVVVIINSAAGNTLRDALALRAPGIARLSSSGPTPGGTAVPGQIQPSATGLHYMQVQGPPATAF